MTSKVHRSPKMSSAQETGQGDRRDEGWLDLTADFGMIQITEQFTCIQQVNHLHYASMNPTPKLATPGAGLPKVERFFANLMIHWKAKRTSREKAAATFAAERDAILHCLRTTPTERLTPPVLIKRLPGLEDSSRYWSLLMTAEHLRIVNAQITAVIASLCAGKVPAGTASTAAVKPSSQVDEPTIDAFEKTCAEFEKTVAAQRALKTTLTFPHPWFGPMDAAAWHFMAGFHMQLHRKQMELILAGLPKK